MHDMWSAADPLDDQHPGAGERPQLERHTLSDFVMPGIATRRTRDDDLQIIQPVEARLGVFVGTPERLLDHGPKRADQEILQAVGQGLRTSGRLARRVTGVRTHATLTGAAIPDDRWQSQGRTRGVGVLSGGSHSCDERGVPVAGISMFSQSLAHRPSRWLCTGGPQVRCATSTDGSQLLQRIAAQRDKTNSTGKPTETARNAERWAAAMFGLLLGGIAIAAVYSFGADLSLGAFAIAAVIGWLGTDALSSAIRKRRSTLLCIWPLP